MKAPLPRANVVLHCEECGQEVCSLDVNARSVASKLMEARRWHARHVHGWTPPEADAGHAPLVVQP